MIGETTKAKRRRNSKVPAVVSMRALARVEEIRTALDYLVDEAGITTTDIGRELGCSRWQVWAWRKGMYEPRLPIWAFIIVEWAAYFKELGPYLETIKELGKAKADGLVK